MALDGDEVDDDDDRDMFFLPPNLWVNAKANTAKATHQSLARSKAPHSFFASFISCLLLFIFVPSLPHSTLRSPLLPTFLFPAAHFTTCYLAAWLLWRPPCVHS